MYVHVFISVVDLDCMHFVFVYNACIYVACMFVCAIAIGWVLRTPACCMKTSPYFQSNMSLIACNYLHTHRGMGRYLQSFIQADIPHTGMYLCVYTPSMSQCAMLPQFLCNSAVISQALPATCFLRAHFRHMCVGVLIDHM